MSQTRPTGDQLRFQSSKTGEHILDDYMESVERGDRTLSSLLNDLWDPNSGALRSNLWDLRVNPATFELEQRVGDYADASTGWTAVDNASFFNYRGAYADATDYLRLDIVLHSGEFFLCTAPHTSSGAAPSGTNFQPLVTLADAGVSTFNGRSGTVLLTSGDVTTALTYTPTSPASLTSALASYLPLSGGTITAATTFRSASDRGSVVLRPSSDATPGSVDFLDGTGDTLGSIGGVPGANGNALRMHVFGESASLDFNVAPTVNGTPLALEDHTHPISDITNLQTTLDGKAPTVHTHPYLPLTGGILTGNVTIQKASPTLTLDGSNPVFQLRGSSSSTSTDIDLWGNVSGVSARIARIRAISTGPGEFRTEADSHTFYLKNGTMMLGALTSSGLFILGRNVLADIDGKAPTVHTHSISQITNLQTTLNDLQSDVDGKAAASHTHAISDITNLQTTLDGKAASSHTHAIANVTNLQSTLDGKAAASHTHPISAITNLQSSLDGKAASSHTHTIANITNLQTTLDGKAPTVHTHSIANVTGLGDALDDKAEVIHTHDIANVTGLQTALNALLATASIAGGTLSGQTYFEFPVTGLGTIRVIMGTVFVAADTTSTITLEWPFTTPLVGGVVGASGIAYSDDHNYFGWLQSASQIRVVNGTFGMSFQWIAIGIA